MTVRQLSMVVLAEVVRHSTAAAGAALGWAFGVMSRELPLTRARWLELAQADGIPADAVDDALPLIREEVAERGVSRGLRVRTAIELGWRAGPNAIA